MRGSKKTFLVLVALAAVVLSGLTITAHAAGVIGGFEIDGNKVDDPGTGVDWLTPNLGATVFNDPEASSGCPAGTDDNFSGGGSKELTPGTWTFDCGNVPTKDDFTEAGIYTTKVGTSNWLFLYFNRVSGNGSAHLNFEFNQLPTTFDNDNNPATPEIPERSTGDLLIVLDATNGGSVTKPGIFKWAGSRTSGTWGSTGGTQVQGTDWDVATDGSGDRFHFAEVAIRLQAFNVNPSCPGLGKAWVKSNSTSLGADFSGGVLKDRTARKDVPLNNCARKDWEFTVNPFGIAGTKVFAVYTVATTPASTRTLELTLGADGKTYTASDAQVPPGSVTYHFEVRDGTNIVYSSAPATETLAPEETKKNSGALTYDITLSPEDAENFSDSFAGSPQPHTLTAKVFNTAGNAGLPFVPVSFANTGSCGTLSATSATTNASGEATTTLTSASPCSTTIRAWVNGTGPSATAGFDTGEASDTATKRFVSYSIAVTPPDVENETDTDHVFTVTVRKDSGSGAAALSGANVSVTLTPGTTGATITSIPGGTIAADGLSGTCTTNASGQCSVTIHGTSPGTAKLTASTTAADSDGNAITINSDGLKRYVSFDLTVTPATAENEVDSDHVFTVTLTRDSGSGPTAIAGASVALTLTPGTTGSTITAVSDGTIAADGLSATCTTDASGQCTVTIHGDTPGTAKLDASWSQQLSGGGTVSKTASGTKTFSAFDLTVTPATAENEVDSDHVFTVTLTRDSGSGAAGVAGETINLTLAPGTTGSTITAVSDGTIAADGLSATCTTDASGQCTVTIHGDTPGTAKLDASWSQQLSGGGTVSKTASGTKTFSAFDLTVTPATAENEVDSDHVFTVTLTRNDGSSTTGVSGASISLTLTPGSTGSTITAVSAGTVAANGLSATCTTDANGQCTVTIHGNAPGKAKLDASWSQQLTGGGTVTKTGSATKTFSAFDLTVTPPSATNEVDTDHTFTVTLTRDSGSGPAGIAGASVALTLTPGTTGSTITAVSAGTIAADGLSATCTTDSSGQCTVTIHGTSPGTATLNASWSSQLSGGGTVSKTASGTKTFGAFDLTVTPGSANNEVGKPHTFTMTLTRDDAGLAGQTIELVLQRPQGSDVHFTAVSGGGTITDDTHATCVTAADGTCTATINGTTPGEVTLTATWHNTIAANGVDQIATATKQYLAFNLTLTPPSATNQAGDSHTFTATLTKDTGTGPGGFGGETISLVLTRPAGSDAHFTAVSGGGAIADDTHATCITAADGTCTATITATTAGQVSVTATWANETVVVGGATKSATATKQFLDFSLDVTPPSANNQVGQPHEFIVTLKQDSGSGAAGLAGETVHLVLTGPAGGDGHFTSINGQDASGTTADCVTRSDDPQTPANEAGTCSVIITSSTPGLYTLTATWNNATIVTGGATRIDSATKNYLSIDVSKTSCPVDETPRGGIVDYTVSFAVGGNGLTNATFTDALPANTTFVSASQIAGVTPTTPAVGAEGGTVKWTFATIGAGSYSGTIRVAVTDDAPLGGTITNTVVLDADEIGPNSASDDITVTDAGRSASGRAYGISLDLLGSEVVPPTPDSDTTNPGEVLSIPDPFGSDTALVKLLSVSESDDSTANQAAHSATATALNVDLNVPGVLHLQASSVVAKSTSQASASGAGSSRGGSLIQNLVINGHEYGNASEPTTINVLDPLSGEMLAEVHLLETTRSGAAGGGTQPDGNLFSSGIAVNGIHVKVHALDLLDLIVSHAEASASFPSGLGCGGAIPSVSGSGYALGVDLRPDSPDGIDLGNVKVAQVNLPSTGGQDDAVLANVDVPDVVKATAAEAHTIGEITDTDNDGVPVEAHTLSRTAGLNLLDGAIVARVIEATSDSTIGSSTGTTTIAHLEIGGTDVCAALGLDPICKPEPNTELVIPGGPVIVELNEQIPEPGGLTVNAVHIWVLGKGNPLGLPVGADIVISNAHSDAHGAGQSTSAAITDRVYTINVKALSSPTALRLKQLKRIQPIRVPVAVPLQQDTAPIVRVPDIIRDPVSVVDELNALPVPNEVIDDATKLVETLTDPEALLEALSDPATLIEGLENPEAAIEALAEAVGVTLEESAEGATTDATPVERQLEAFLKKLALL